jgi:zinc protease
MKATLQRILLLLFALVSSLSAQDRFRRQAPLPDPLPALTLPGVSTNRLSNNLNLFVVHKQKLSHINLHLTVLTGESSSPDALPGLATFTANMISHGSENFSADEIEEAIDRLGGRFFIQTFPDYTTFSLTFLEENLDAALELFSDMLIRPDFSRREIEDLQRTTFYDLAGKRTDPEFAGKKLLYQILFRDHAYQKILYNDDIIRKYGQNDIRAFYENFYLPNNSLLLITGNLTLEMASRKISRYFNTWKEKDLKRIHLSAPEPDETAQICFLEIPRLRDATLFMGTLLPPKVSNDYFPLLVLNQVLGGTEISRLLMNLRESRGYAWWAYSHMEFFRYCGVFYIRARVKPEAVQQSVGEILREIRTISNQRISNQEIEIAKSYLLGQFPLNVETYADLAAHIADVEAFGLGQAYLDKYFESIMVIDAQTVFETAQRNSLFTPIIVIVGDKSVLDKIGFEKIDVYNNKGDYIHSLVKGEKQ